jgi:hypothetical protein
MRVDVQAEFYGRVKPDATAISTAAQTLGRRTMEPAALKELVRKMNCSTYRCRWTSELFIAEKTCVPTRGSPRAFLRLGVAARFHSAPLVSSATTRESAAPL